MLRLGQAVFAVLVINSIAVIFNMSLVADSEFV